ncbi:MAG: SDR family oxidoreductase [Patescibacteria group bacterium]
MFKDKIILILGGTGSIGSSIAEAFNDEGAIVCCHGQTGGYSADLRNSTETTQLIEKIIGKYGFIDVIVNSVSNLANIASFEKKDWADFIGHLEIQLKSCVETTKLVLPYMKKRGNGKIINILSSYTIGSPPSSLSDYVTAKYALLGLTKALAKELGRFNINVNAVSPSFIKNSFTKNIPEKLDEILISQTPMGRLTTEKDVANTVLFLASEKANFISGENIVVSGGSVMN